MERLYLWPANPAASLIVLWILSQVFFYAARAPMHKALHSVARLLGGMFRIVARWCRSMAAGVVKRDREMVLEMGKGDLDAKIGREFHRIENAFGKELSRYPELHRKIDDVVTKVDQDFQESASTAPAAPGWSEAVVAVARGPPAGVGGVRNLSRGTHKSAVVAEKKVLEDFPAPSPRAHRTPAASA